MSLNQSGLWQELGPEAEKIYAAFEVEQKRVLERIPPEIAEYLITRGRADSQFLERSCNYRTIMSWGNQYDGHFSDHAAPAHIAAQVLQAVQTFAYSAGKERLPIEEIRKKITELYQKYPQLNPTLYPDIIARLKRNPAGKALLDGNGVPYDPAVFAETPAEQPVTQAAASAASEKPAAPSVEEKPEAPSAAPPLSRRNALRPENWGRAFAAFMQPDKTPAQAPAATSAAAKAADVPAATPAQAALPAPHIETFSPPPAREPVEIREAKVDQPAHVAARKKEPPPPKL